MNHGRLAAATASAAATSYIAVLKHKVAFKHSDQILTLCYDYRLRPDDQMLEKMASVIRTSRLNMTTLPTTFQH